MCILCIPFILLLYSKMLVYIIKSEYAHSTQSILRAVRYIKFDFAGLTCKGCDMICKTHSLNGDMFLNVRKGLSKNKR
jgi:hypothetical protein